MKWYLNSKNLGVLRDYANHFPIFMTDHELSSSDPSFSKLPINSLLVEEIEERALWQRIVNYFKGAKRYEIKQLDHHEQVEKWKLSQYESELLNIIRVGLNKKQKKIQETKSGKVATDDNSLFILKLLEHVTYESLAKSKSEYTRLMMYQKLLSMLQVMILDAASQSGKGWLIEILEMATEKVDEMIQHENEQNQLKSFQDAVNEIHLGSVLMKVNEELIGSLTSKSMQDHIFYHGTRLNLANIAYDDFRKSREYQTLGKQSKRILRERVNYDVIQKGWMMNSRDAKLFRETEDKRYLKKISEQKVSEELIKAAIRPKLPTDLGQKEYQELVKLYKSAFDTLNQVYILNNLLGLIKKKSMSYGQSANVLYQRQIRFWFERTFEALDSLDQDLKKISTFTKVTVPYLDVYEGRGLFVTSALTIPLNKIKNKLIQARRYMHIDQSKMIQEHDQFNEVMTYGLSQVKDYGRYVASNNVPEASRYGLFANNTQPLQAPQHSVQGLSMSR